MKSILATLLVLVAAVALAVFYCSNMPGQSTGTVTARPTEDEREIAEHLKEACETLAHKIGQRSTIRQGAVSTARDYIEQRLQRSGLQPKETTFTSHGDQGVNVEAIVEGTSAREEFVVVGAHYDTSSYTPGADDNASGTAMLLELARMLGAYPHTRSLALVFFDRGGSRFAGQDSSGSHAWAFEAKRAGRKVVAMVSIDSIGFYSDQPGSQGGPFPLSLAYPGTGNFVLFAGDFASRQMVQSSVQTFRTLSGFPCEGVTMPGSLPWISRSDAASFWRQDWPAMIVTDTGPLRNLEHGLMTDTYDRLNYDRMALVTTRLAKVIERLAQQGAGSGSIN